MEHFKSKGNENVYPEANVTREFAADTLNFCLGYQLGEDAVYTFSDTDAVDNIDSAQVAVNRGWFQLIDGEFSPETFITVSEDEVMLADAAAVWSSTEVDTNYNNTYEFVDGVIDITENTEAYLLDDGRIYIVESPVDIQNGDKVAIYLNGIPCVYLISDVEKSGEDLIIAGAEVNHEDAYEDIDIQGTLDASTLQIGDVPEGMDVEYTEETETALPTNVALKAKALKKVKGTINLNKKTKISASGKIDVGDGQSVSVKMNVKNAKIDYKVSLTGETFVKLSGDSSLSCSASFDTMKAIGMDSRAART